MKEILITGASTGIGLALTEAFLQKGDIVWAGVRKPETLQRLEAKYPQLHILKLDVTSPADIENAWQEISTKRSSHAFVLINNAGIAIGGPVEALSLAKWRDIFDVNLFAMVSITSKFLPLIRATKGRIVNIGSISGRIASPYLGPYCASKFAVRSFSDSLRREMRPFGVKVILVEPGPIQTPIWKKSMDQSMDIQKQLSSELATVYEEPISYLTSAVSTVVKTAVPVSWVTKKVLLAVESKHPKAYYLVGKHIHIQAALAKWLPAKWLDRILSWGYRFRKGRNNP